MLSISQNYSVPDKVQVAYHRSIAYSWFEHLTLVWLMPGRIVKKTMVNRSRHSESNGLAMTAYPTPLLTDFGSQYLIRTRALSRIRFDWRACSTMLWRAYEPPLEWRLCHWFYSLSYCRRLLLCYRNVQQSELPQSTSRKDICFPT